MDTTRDIRIAFMDKAVVNLTAQAKSGFFGPVKKHPHVAKGLVEIANLLLTLKYSYLDDSALGSMPEHEVIRSTADKLLDTLRQLSKGDREKLALLRFYRHTLGQLKPSFQKSTGLEGVISMGIGRVITTSKHPKAKNLLLCNVDVFGQNLSIVTNLVKTKPRQLLKVALVPPTEVMGILSEAQFVGNATEADAKAGSVQLTDDEAQEIRKTLGGFFED